MKNLMYVILALCVVSASFSSCVNFKTEATVNVEVVKAGAPVPGAVVYKFHDNGLGEGTTLYKSNATGHATANAGGVAHFDLKSPDDFTPSDIAGMGFEEENTFFFCTYDAENTRNSIVVVKVKTGDKKTVQLVIEDNPQSGDE